MSTHVLTITDFGACGDGHTLCTAAVQRALDAVHAAGGGTVLVPPGRFLIGTIFVRSRTTLELLPGATLLGSPRLADYTAVPRGCHGDRTPFHLVVVDDACDVTLRGPGTIDGQGPAFWEPTTGPALHEVPASIADPARAALAWIDAPSRHHGRPSPMVEVRFSRDVRVENLHLTNSAGWTLHFLDCDRVWVRGIKLTSNLMGPNNDGIDITGCHDVMISDCDLSCCDDAVCLKTYPNERSCERVTVTNCVIRTRCAAFKTGEAFGHFRQIAFSNSVVYECSRAVALYANNGCLVEDVTISNIVCDTRSPLLVNRPIHLDARTLDGDVPAVPPVGIRNVHISDVICRTDGRILLTAEPGAMLDGVVLRNVRLVYPTVDDPDPIARDAGGGQFSNNNPAARVARAAVVAENVAGLVVDGLQIHWPTPDADGRVPCPDEWRFPLKAANGSMRIYERREFNTDTLPPFAVLWGRNLQGGLLDNPLAGPSRPGVPKYDLAGSRLITRD